jgi:anti-sigma B factor antagonist
VEIGQSLEIVVEPRDRGAAVVRPIGRLDLASGPGLRQRLGEALVDGHLLLVVDLAATTFADTTGLGAILAGWNAARRAGGDLRLARPGAAVQFVLERTTLDRVLRPYDTVERALAGG